MTNNTEPFEELFIPRRETQGDSATRYRVYTDAKNYKLVEAVSALDAITNSGVARAYKIERHNPMGENIIHINISKNQPIQRAEAKAIVAEAAPIAEEIAPPETSAEPSIQADTPPAAALSNDDVEKLLNGA